MREVELRFDEKNLEFMVGDEKLRDLLEEHYHEPVGVVVVDDVSTKRTNLTRGEILRGMELGLYEEGDQFIRRDNGMIITVMGDGTIQYNAISSAFGFKVVPEEIWDVHLGIEIGDWVAKIVSDGEVSVAKVKNAFIINDVPKIQIGFAGRLNEWLLDNVRKATEEEIKVAKRAEPFVAKGRQFNEYKIGDVISLGVDYARVSGVDEHGVYIVGKSWIDKSIAPVPVFFMEDMVTVDEG